MRYVFQLYTFSGEPLVWWRLMSSNGRFLARCVEPSGSVAGARDAIAATVRALADASIVVRPTSENRWAWSVVRGGSVIAQGHGDQDRRVRCEDAAHRFVAVAPEAPVDASVHVFRRRSAPVRASGSIA